MRSAIILTLLISLSLVGCGSDETDETSTDLAPPAVADTIGDPNHDMGINTEITLDDQIAATWRGAIIEISGPEGEPERFDLTLGQAVTLGETGLTATALVFVPDFVMGEDGITSRSAEAANPALRLLVTEEGRPDYEGWLFAALPEIHPFPHETYSILLVDGLSTE